MHHGFAQDLDTFSERVQDFHLLNLAEIVDQSLVKERENKKKVGKPGKGGLHMSDYEFGLGIRISATTCCSDIHFELSTSSSQQLTLISQTISTTNCIIPELRYVRSTVRKAVKKITAAATNQGSVLESLILSSRRSICNRR